MAVRARRDQWLWLLSVITVFALAACNGEPVRLDPDDLPQPIQATPNSLDLPSDPSVLLEMSVKNDGLVQKGSAEVEVDVVTLDGGSLDIVQGRDSLGAIDFPPHSDGAVYPRAVVRVLNSSGRDQLAPGERDFVWGADFVLDEKSFGGALDNGDNLVQRGLSSHPTFFKAEVDDDRAACTVRGDSGTVIIRASERLRPGTWYRIRCERKGDSLSVYVTEYGEDGAERSYASRIDGEIGNVAIRDRTIAFSVGGKIGVDQNLIAAATDQFNGLVTNPVLAVGTQMTQPNP